MQIKFSDILTKSFFPCIISILG